LDEWANVEKRLVSDDYLLFISIHVQVCLTTQEDEKKKSKLN